MAGGPGPAVEAALQAALANQQFEDVAPILDAAELESTNPDVLAEWPHALHMLGLIYNKQLEEARFLWKRIPPEAKAGDAELDAVWRLLTFAWNGHLRGVWGALTGFAWSAPVRPFVDALAAKTRREALALLSEAYSLVSPAKAAALLGVPEAEVAGLAEAAGWRQDMESGAFVAAPQEPADDDLDGLEGLAQLAQCMVRLEGGGGQ